LRLAWSRASTFFQGFELVEGAGPVGAEETREAAVREDLSVGLALRAVVGFVVGVADSLDGCAAGWAGLSEAAVHGHVFAEGGDFFGEGCGGFGVEAGYPKTKRVASGGEEALPLVFGEFVGLQDGGEMGRVEDLVGVSVADAGEDARVGEGSLEGAVFGGEGSAEGCEVGNEDAAREEIKAAGVDVFCGRFVGEEVEGGAAFGAGFGEDERAVGKIEGGEIVAAAEFGAERTPVEAAGDHEMEDEPDAVIELEDDAFADAVQRAHGVAFYVFDARLYGAEKEGAGDAELGEGLANDAG